MIQLASDPNARRSGWRPSGPAAAAKPAVLTGRAAHAWPFLSKVVERPASPDAQRRPGTESGS